MNNNNNMKEDNNNNNNIKNNEKKKKKKKKAKRNRRQIKTAKGAIDTNPNEMILLTDLFNNIRKVFRKHRGEEIDTPVFELKSTLTEKYGEDSKLIYDLADQGGEDLALRYDLTVPFARYCAQNGVQRMKRYQIGKVYRRDQPSIQNGRYREFWQCDFDIVGDYGDQRMPEAEILAIMCEILTSLELKFVVKFNHRILLDGIMAVCGVEEENFRAICSSIDKLDKESWDNVKKEMIDDKGLNEIVADKIGEYVKLKGEPYVILELLKKDEALNNIKNIKQTIEELDLLFQYLKAFNIYDFISFDLSLARGLDYYTGVIYEAVVIDSDVGSISAGGRYDNLIGMFASNLPAIGFSLGIQRILTILNRKQKQQNNQTMVFVAAEEKVSSVERAKLCAEFWKSDISCGTLFKNAKTNKQWQQAEKQNYRYYVCIQNDEKVQVINIVERSDPEEIDRKDVVQYIIKKENLK